MSEIDTTDAKTAAKGGRKLDESRDAAILEAALDVLAETGYAGMTMTLVAARAKAGKGAMYRRWASKEDLVIDAVAHMGRQDVDLELLPDTGSLRGDMIAMSRPESIEEEQRRLRVLAGLTSMALVHEGIGEAATEANIGTWIRANRILIQRAVDRGEARADADVETLARVIPAICATRSSLERKPITAEFLTGLLDEVLLPALAPRH